MSNSQTVNIWYQVHDGQVVRPAMLLRSFAGEYVIDLSMTIVDTSHLDISPDMLQLLVKHNETDEEMNLFDLEGDKGIDFSTLIADYGIKKLNPIIVRLPGTLLVLLFLSWL